MKFLKAIATPFVAIWRWIKETAWVQPLLIVGAIFGVIFSIPSITSWVKSWDFGDDTYKYLENNQLSLEGLTGEDNSGEVMEFVDAYTEARTKFENGDKAGAREAMKKYAGNDGKMLIYFINKNNTILNCR